MIRWLISDRVVTGLAVGFLVYAAIAAAAHFIGDAVGDRVMRVAEAEDARRIREEIKDKGYKIGAVVGIVLAVILISTNAFE